MNEGCHIAQAKQAVTPNVFYVRQPGCVTLSTVVSVLIISPRLATCHTVHVYKCWLFTTTNKGGATQYVNRRTVSSICVFCLHIRISLTLI